MEAVEDRFRVMGSGAHVIVVSPGDPHSLLVQARQRLGELERRWSRFEPDSTVSRLNAADGRSQPVDPDTLTLVLRSRDAWNLTGGMFDPTTLRSLMSAGYRASRDEDGHAGHPSDEPGEPSPGLAGVEIDVERQRVRLPAGVSLDPGGIGKGLAADLLAEELMAAGALGVLVNVGGDLRVTGVPSIGDRWMVTIEDPFDSASNVARLHLREGGVATSTPEHRRWRVGGRPGIHIIDPRSGRPVETDVASVSVATAQTWMAEAVAKAVAVAGSVEGLEIVEQAGLAGIVVTTDGDIQLSSRLGAFL